jgi:hypothetical protein
MEERASRRTPRERGGFALLRVLLVFVLLLGALGGCGGSENRDQQVEKESVREPSKKEAADAENVVVRVSGTSGTAYSGFYGTPTMTRNVGTTTLGVEPTDYEVEVEDEAGLVNATFKKVQPGREILQVEILVDGEVVTRSETSAELGPVTAQWEPPETALERTTLPKEFEKDRSK